MDPPDNAVRLDTAQAAALLGITPERLNKLCNDSVNPPPFVRVSRRTKLFKAAELEQWQKRTWAQHHRSEVS